MKFLDCSSSKDRLDSIKVFLREKGILVYSSDDFENEDIANCKTGIWVVFNKQYLDAYKLLKNKKHKVLIKLSMDEMKKFEKESKENFFRKTKMFFAKAFSVFIIISLVGFIVFIVLKNL